LYFVFVVCVVVWGSGVPRPLYARGGPLILRPLFNTLKIAYSYIAI
jgi:hypothetical protein